MIIGEVFTNRKIEAVVLPAISDSGTMDAYTLINERLSGIEEKLHQNVDTQRIWQAHHPMIDAVDSSNNLPADIAIGKDFESGDKITPSVVVVSRIKENHNNNNGNTNTAFANIYSYIEQTGKESQKYCKAIAGVTVNASGGDNDSSAVVGYSYKKDVPANGDQKAGIGDTVGTGGAAYQYSRQKGLVKETSHKDDTKNNRLRKQNMKIAPET